MVSGSWTTCSRQVGPYRSLKYSGVWVLRRLLSHRTGVPYGHRRHFEPVHVVDFSLVEVFGQPDPAPRRGARSRIALR